MSDDIEQKNVGRNGGRQLNEQHAPQNQETEDDFRLGIGSDLKPLNGEPVPPEGLGKDGL